MRNLLILAVIAVGAVGLLLAAPAAVQAQPGCGYGGASYSGYGGYGGYYDRGSYNRGYGSGYGGYYDRGYAPGYGRSVIKHPTYGHWTPDRGYHTHGHIHVPHRGHYHTYRY